MSQGDDRMRVESGGIVKGTAKHKRHLSGTGVKHCGAGSRVPSKTRKFVHAVLTKEDSVLIKW